MAPRGGGSRLMVVNNRERDSCVQFVRQARRREQPDMADFVYRQPA